MKAVLKGMKGLKRFFFLSETLYQASQRLSHSLASWKRFNPLVRDLAKVKWMVELTSGTTRPTNF